MKSIGEEILLPFIYIKLLCFNALEEWKIRRRFYGNPLFKKTDKALQKLYRFKNPYLISKKFMQKKGEDSVHTYGETPLSVFNTLFNLCHLQKEDRFLDLGAGRGRGVFFASTFFGCTAMGVDFVPDFYDKAESLAKTLDNPPLFYLEDMLSFDLSKANVIYFYALCMDEAPFLAMISRLESLEKGTRVITVSFPLSDYLEKNLKKNLEKCSLIASATVSYPWGQTTVYVNLLN